MNDEQAAPVEQAIEAEHGPVSQPAGAEPARIGKHVKAQHRNQRSWNAKNRKARKTAAKSRRQNRGK